MRALTRRDRAHEPDVGVLREPRAALVGYAAGAVLLVAAYGAMNADSLVIEAWLAAAAITAGAAGRWWERGRTATAFMGAVGLTVAVSLQTEKLSLTVVTIISALAVTIYAGRSIKSRRRRARAIAFLADGLATFDSGPGKEQRTRERIDVLQWGRHDAIARFVWYYPNDLAIHDPKTTQRVVSVVNSRIKAKCATSWGDRRVTFSTLVEAEREPKREEEGGREEIALQGIVSELIGEDARVYAFTYDEQGGVNGLSITWPPRLSNRVSELRDRKKLERRIFDTIEWSEGAAEWRLKSQTVDLKEVDTSLPAKICATSRMREKEAIVFGVHPGNEMMRLILAADREPHMLVAGPTRSGKTSFLRTFLCMLPYRDQAEIILVDPKRFELREFEGFQGVKRRDKKAAEIVAGVEWLNAEMERRNDAIDADPKMREYFQEHRLFWVCDEGKQAYDMLSDHWLSVDKPAMQEEKKHDKSAPNPPPGSEHPAWGLLKRVLQLGGAAGVHVVMLTQQPDGEWIGTSTRANYGLKVVLGALGDEGARMMLGSRWWRAATQAPALNKDGAPIKGRVLVQEGMGQKPRRGQVLWTPEPDSSKPDDRKILRDLGLSSEVEPEPSSSEVERPRMHRRDPGQFPAAGALPDNKAPESEDGSTGARNAPATPVLVPSETGDPAEHPAAGALPRGDEGNDCARRADLYAVPDEDDEADETPAADSVSTEEREVDRINVGDLVLTDDSPRRVARIVDVEPDQHADDATMLTVEDVETSEIECYTVDDDGVVDVVLA